MAYLSRYQRYQQRQQQHMQEVGRVVQATYEFSKEEQLDRGIILAAVTIIMECDLSRRFPREAILDLSKRNTTFAQQYRPHTRISTKSKIRSTVQSTAQQLSKLWETLHVSDDIVECSMYNIVRHMWKLEYGEQVAQEWEHVVLDWTNQWAR
jgi:hypothetical protein